MDQIVYTIIQKTEAAERALAGMNEGAFFYALFVDVDRETFLIQCDLEDIEETQRNLQTILDQGARPVCLVIVPIKRPTFVELDKDFSVDDRVIIDAWMEGGGYALISRRKEPPKE
jgi:hypothetical protein